RVLFRSESNFFKLWYHTASREPAQIAAVVFSSRIFTFLRGHRRKVASVDFRTDGLDFIQGLVIFTADQNMAGLHFFRFIVFGIVISVGLFQALLVFRIGQIVLNFFLADRNERSKGLAGDAHTMNNYHIVFKAEDVLGKVLRDQSRVEEFINFLLLKIIGH